MNRPAAKLFSFLGICLLTVSSVSIAVADDQDSGFLEDYSKLKASSVNDLTRYYLAPDARNKLLSYDNIMVDHPEIFLAEDSPYKGIKASRIAVIADAFRQQVINALSDDYTVVETAGPKTLYLKLALTDLKVSKNRTKILGYTPAGLVFRAGKSAVQSDYANAVQHMSLVDLKIEGEILDSETSELIGEFVNDHGDVDTPQNWKELLTDMQKFGDRIQCQLNNARAEAAKRVDCSVNLEPK